MVPPNGSTAVCSWCPQRGVSLLTVKPNRHASFLQHKKMFPKVVVPFGNIFLMTVVRP